VNRCGEKAVELLVAGLDLFDQGQHGFEYHLALAVGGQRERTAEERVHGAASGGFGPLRAH